MLYVYRHIRLDTNTPFYIGIGSHCSENKVETYARAYSRTRNKFWKYIADKTNYRVEILFENLTREDACNKEIEFILLYGRCNIKTGTLVNLTAGGDGLLDPSTNVRKRMSERALYNHKNHPELYQHTKITRDKISKALRGKKKSDEHKLNLSKSKLGKKLGPMSAEQKAKLSLKLTGTKRPDVSERNKNRTPPNTGKIFITNMITNKLIYPHEQLPSGWILGKIRKNAL
jgi:hypothetical protein